MYADHQQPPLRPHINGYGNNLRTSSYYTTTTLGGAHSNNNNNSRGGIRYNGATNPQGPTLPGQRPQPPYMNNGRPSPLGSGTLQPPKQYDSYYYHPSTLGPAQRSASNNKPPLPSSSSHGVTAPSPGAPQTAGPNNKVVYADLSLEGTPMGAGRDPRSTDYAVLKFNTKNVGKEIDV